jgi:nitrate reductase gamma subunit
MIPEILFLKGLWEFNRSMWYVSYPFHLGLYLVAATAALLGCAVAAPSFAPILHPVYSACGIAGAVLGLAGAVGLLVRRCRNPELRMYSTRGDFFNLALFAATFTLLIAGQLLRPTASPGPIEILRGAAAFRTSLKIPAVLTAGLALGAFVPAYIPMTHMAHFIAKYFTYHAVRWDERENPAGGSIEKKLAEYLMYRPNWAARHVGATGEKTWADIATANPAQGGAK